MNNKDYKEPTVLVININNVDVITASPNEEISQSEGIEEF